MRVFIFKVFIVLAQNGKHFCRYDVLFTDRKDRNGKEFAALSGRPARHSRFAKDITVGLRWNVTPSFMLRAEYHRVNGTAWISTLDNPDPANTSQHWNLFAILSFFPLLEQNSMVKTP